MKNQVSNDRSSLIPVFSEIVKENHKKVLSLDVQIKKLDVTLTNAVGDDYAFEFTEKVQPLEDKLAKASLIVIVFSAMALEAYIYDYAARHLTDAFAKNHLDKLDTFSKWIIVPVVITGKELSQRPNWHEPLKQLIKARNSIIHHKSTQPPDSFHDAKKYLEKLQANSADLLDTAKQSTQLLKMLADKITEIDPEETPWVNSYLT
jgi:hypothetical protein